MSMLPPHHSCLYLSMSTLLPSRITHLLLSTLCLGIINYHHAQAERAQSSVMQPVTLSASTAVRANFSAESVASNFPYHIYHPHTCPHTKKKRVIKIVVGSCSSKLFIQPFPHLPPKNLSLKPSVTRIRLCGHTSPDCKPQRK